MRLESLHEFVVFAKHLSVNAAAKELHLSQPSLSVHLSNMETELGFLLVDRDRGYRITPAGDVFLLAAQKILDIYADAAVKGKALSKEQPPVRISNMPSEILRLLKGIPFTIIEPDLIGDPLKNIIKNRADIFGTLDFTSSEKFLKTCKDHGIEYCPLGKMDLVLVLMSSHPLAKKEVVDRSDLKFATIVINMGSYFDYWKETLNTLLGVDLNLKFRLESIDSLPNLAYIDFGDSIHVCEKLSMESYLKHRDDVHIIEQVNGLDLSIAGIALYKADTVNKNVQAAAQVLQEYGGVSTATAD